MTHEWPAASVYVAGIGPIYTAYDEQRAKEAKMSIKQKQARARRQLKKVVRSYLDLESKNASGHNYERLLMIRRHCQLEQIEEPPWLDLWIRLHVAAQERLLAQMAQQSEVQ